MAGSGWSKIRSTSSGAGLRDERTEVSVKMDITGVTKTNDLVHAMNGLSRHSVCTSGWLSGRPTSSYASRYFRKVAGETAAY